MASGSAEPEASPITIAYPVPLPNSASGQTPSVISSRMTDLESENDDACHAEAAVPSLRPETAISGGTSSNDLYRPASAVSSQPRSWTFSQNSRRGIGSPRAFGNWRLNGAFGGPGTMISNNSRPESNTSSRTSKTHIPSLASHAFFRPMSSQRLQAQRGSKRPDAHGYSIASIDGASDFASTTNRNSIGSNTTALTGNNASQTRHVRPQSIGTDFTEREDLPAANDSLAGNATHQSIGESAQPLNEPSKVVGLPSMPEKNDQHPNGTAPLIRRSPRSFRPSFLLPSRYSDQVRNKHFSHERLSSSNSSPRSINAKMISKPTKKTGFNYQYFTGNTVFCWGGRLQNTRDRPINVISGILILLPSLLFLACSGPYLSQHVSTAIPVLYAYIFFICISSFIHASVTDPGILPRNLHPQTTPENSEDPLTLGPPTTDWVRVKSYMPGTSAMDVPTKYCKTCSIWRPLRCHHCRICDNCIETQDHHCVWINNCVGRRNYRYFLTFTSTGTILGVFLSFASLGHCMRYQSDGGISFAQSIATQRVPFAMFLYGLLASPYPACLWAYHLYLMGRGETTREYLNSHRFLKKDRHRPFSQGSFLRNWLVVLLRPRAPTYLHLSKEYEEGDRRFGERRGKRAAPLLAEQPNGVNMEMQGVRGTETSFQGPVSLRAS